jgi:hypothetical protein
MKKMLVLLLALLTVGCAGTKVYMFGVDTDIITEAKGKDLAYTVAGVVTSVATHVAGHMIAAEVFDVDYEFVGSVPGMKEEISDDCWNGGCSQSDLQWFARSGFVLQNGIATVLTSFEGTRKSYFTKGFVTTTAVHTWTYPWVNDTGYHDFKMLDAHGGNGNSEYGIYSAIALHNMLRIPKSQKDQQ